MSCNVEDEGEQVEGFSLTNMVHEVPYDQNIYIRRSKIAQCKTILIVG